MAPILYFSGLEFLFSFYLSVFQHVTVLLLVLLVGVQHVIRKMDSVTVRIPYKDSTVMNVRMATTDFHRHKQRDADHVHVIWEERILVVINKLVSKAMNNCLTNTSLTPF